MRISFLILFNLDQAAADNSSAKSQAFLKSALPCDFAAFVFVLLWHRSSLPDVNFINDRLKKLVLLFHCYPLLILLLLLHLDCCFL